MSDSPSAPPPPDYTGAAKETAAGNLEATRAATTANRVDTFTPYGNLTYSQDATNPDRWTSNVSLSDTGQSLLDQQNKTSIGLGNLQDAATARVGNSLNSAMPGLYDPYTATNNATALINARLAPQQARDSAALESQLANQGLTPGSEAYNNAKTLQSQSQNDAQNQAALQGITLGQNQQAQQYAQETANRNAPINELSAIRTGSQVTNPTFQSSPTQATTNGADTLGATTQAANYAQGLYGSQVASANSGNAALGGLASAGILAYAF